MKVKSLRSTSSVTLSWRKPQTVQTLRVSTGGTVI